MSRNRLIVLIAGALGVLAIAAFGIGALTRPASDPAVAVPAPAPPGQPLPLIPAPSGPAADPTPSVPVNAAPTSQAATNPGGEAEPFVQSFAEQPGVKPLPRKPSPTAKRSMPAFADGCDHGYGNRDQCIPLTFPDGTDDKCRWLADRGFTKVAVAGTDRHRLDPDGNGIACDN